MGRAGGERLGELVVGDTLLQHGIQEGRVDPITLDFAGVVIGDETGIFLVGRVQGIKGLGISLVASLKAARASATLASFFALSVVSSLKSIARCPRSIKSLARSTSAFRVSGSWGFALTNPLKFFPCVFQ